MGTAERGYGQETGGSNWFSSIPPVVRWLLMINVAVFVLDALFLKGVLREFGAFSVRSAFGEGKIWELVTFQFLHGSIGHVLFNCIGLYFFGPWMERWWGSNRFLAFYLLCGAAGALFYTLLTVANVFPDGAYSSLVGASAGIYGILAGVAVISPNMRVSLIFPPIELSMRQMALALLAISVGSIVLKLGGNEGGEAGHLGGAILGFCLVKFPFLLGWAKRRERDVQIIRPKAFSRKSEAKLRPRSKIDLDQNSAVDLILDKISREGFHSLTPAERETLDKVAKSHQTKND